MAVLAERALPPALTVPLPSVRPTLVTSNAAPRLKSLQGYEQGEMPVDMHALISVTPPPETVAEPRNLILCTRTLTEYRPGSRDPNDQPAAFGAQTSTRRWNRAPYGPVTTRSAMSFPALVQIGRAHV